MWRCYGGKEVGSVEGLEYLLELKEQLENEIKIEKSRIEYREKRLKILNDLIKKEQQEGKNVDFKKEI